MSRPLSCLVAAAAVVVASGFSHAAIIDVGLNNRIVIDTADPTDYDYYLAAVLSGRNDGLSGLWTGTTGFTSQAAIDAPNTYAVGIARGDQIGSPTSVIINGIPETINNPATAVHILGTLAGDANLDGSVNVGDLGALASGWNTAGTWAQGDFDFSGAVDVGDLGILASNWNSITPSTALSMPVYGALTAVPEAGTLLLLGLAAPALLVRRRSR